MFMSSSAKKKSREIEVEGLKISNLGGNFFGGQFDQKIYFVKVGIFWEGHKILLNLHCRFDRYYIRQIYGGDFAKICGLLRIYEL